MKTEKSSILNIIILILTVLSLNQSCTKNEIDFDDPNGLTKLCDDIYYLDYRSNVNYSPWEMSGFLDQARERLDPFTIIDNDQFRYTITSGKDVGMSNDLFNLFLSYLRITNEKINNGELCIVDGVLINPNGDIEENSEISTLREGGYVPKYQESTDLCNWGTRVTTTYNQEGALDYYQNYNSSQNMGSINAAISIVAGLGASYYTGGLSALMSVLGTISEYETRRVCDEMYRSARQGGLRVISDRYYNGYRVVKVYSGSGKLIHTIQN